MTAGRTARETIIVCGVAGVIAIICGAVLGHPSAGLALATGLVLGSANGFLAQRALGHDAPFQATSLGRLLLLSGAGLAIGFLAFPDSVALVLLGLGLAQLALAGSALRAVLRA